MSRLLHWLTDRGIPSLQDVNAEHCQQYLSHRSHTYADDGEVRGDLGSSTRRMAVQVILDLINYRDLFTADRVRGDLLPWGTQSSSAIADAQAGWRQNKTPPVDQEVLQPMLSAALYLAGTLGPHVVALTQQSQAALRTRRQLPKPRRCPVERFTAVLGDHVRDGIPLPQLAVQFAHERLTAGWASGDPILPVSLTMLAAEAGVETSPARGCRTCVRRSKTRSARSVPARHGDNRQPKCPPPPANVSCHGPVPFTTARSSPCRRSCAPRRSW